jgi:hypothetical protein
MELWIKLVWHLRKSILKLYKFGIDALECLDLVWKQLINFYGFNTCLVIAYFLNMNFLIIKLVIYSLSLLISDLIIIINLS